MIGSEVVLENSPDFPGIPVAERYSTEFCQRLIPREHPEEFVGMLYDPETDTFSEPPEPEPQPEPEPVPPTPTAWEQLEAQVLFTAVSTDTLLEDAQNMEG